MQTEKDWKGTKDGAWIQTYTGAKFNVFDPEISAVNILDIAHALSMCTRFNGHLSSYYSVAEHSVLMSRMVGKDDQLAALLHDAAEAYLSDVPRPIKYMLPAVKELDQKVSACILEKYGVDNIPAYIHDLDRSMCLTEAKASGMNTDEWTEGHEQYGIVEVRLFYWNWKTARAMFLNRFDYLTGGRYAQEYDGEDFTRQYQVGVHTEHECDPGC